MVTLIEDYVSRDEGRAAAAPSPTCRSQIDFVGELDVPEFSLPPTHEELQQEQPLAATKVLSSTLPINSPYVISFDPTIVHNEAGSIEFIPPVNVES